VLYIFYVVQQQYFSPVAGVLSIVMSMSVCLFVRLHNSKTTRLNFNFLCILPVAVAFSSTDSVAIRYVLLVLWMTSCFHTMVPVGQNQATSCFEVCLVTVSVGRQTTTVFDRVHQSMEPPAKSASLLTVYCKNSNYHVPFPRCTYYQALPPHMTACDLQKSFNEVAISITAVYAF